MEYCSHLLVVCTAKHELTVVECLLRKERESLFAYLEDFLTLEFAN